MTGPHRSVRGWWCLFLITVLCTRYAVGQGIQTLTRDMEVMNEVDTYHERISRTVLNTTDALDRFFADDRILEETDRTQVRLTTRIRYEDREDFTITMSASGRIAMPYFRNRLQLFLDSDTRERDIREGFQDVPETTEEDKSIFAGLRYVPQRTTRTRVNIDGGLRWRRGPSPLIRLRARREWSIEDWSYRVTQTFFWFEDRGFGETTRFDAERRLDDQHFVRLSPSATWSETSKGVNLRQTFNIFHIRDEETVIAFELEILGHTRPRINADNFEGAIRWRQRAFRDWIYYEVAPGIAFRRDHDFKMSALITCRLEVLFGETVYW